MAKKTKPKHRLTFLDGFKPNFETLRLAARNGDLALVELRERSTGKLTAGLAAVDRSEPDNVNIVPVGRMIEGNPYEMFDPPSPEGGFFVDGDALKNELAAKLQEAEGQVHMLRLKLGLPQATFPHPEDADGPQQKA